MPAAAATAERARSDGIADDSVAHVVDLPGRGLSSMITARMRARSIAVWLVAGQLVASDVRASPVGAAATIFAPADEGTTAIVRAELEIDADLGDASRIIADRVRVRGEALLRKREILPARDADDPRIAIRIERLQDAPGYRCRFSVQQDGAAVEGSEGVSECPVCTEAELVEHVEAAIERVASRVPSVAPPPPVVAPPSTVDDPPRKAPLGALGKSGIGVSSVGVVGVVVGAVLVTRPQTRGSELEGEATDLRKPGIAVIAIGCALLIGGLAMLAVDRHRARRPSSHARRSGTRPDTSLSPALRTAG